MQPTLGKEKVKIQLFSESGMDGHISVYEEGVLLKAGRTVEIKNGYVAGVEKTGERALGKVDVKFSYYDAFGNKETPTLVMRDNDYKVLKKLLGK